MKCIVFIFLILCFFNLSASPFLDNLNSSKENKTVEIRGFLFYNEDGDWFLSEKANLKSCCIGASHKIKEQIVVQGIFPKAFNNTVHTLTGTLVLDEQWNEKGSLIQYYRLENASKLRKEGSLMFWVILVVTIFFALFTLGIYKKINKIKIH